MYEESTDRTLLQKILLILLLALAIIFTILMAVVKSQPQVKWADGLLRPELALAWYYGLPHENEADLRRIRDRFMPKGGTL